MSVWEEIVDYTVPSNTTQVDFTGLNITKDDFIKINISDLVGSFYINDNTTSSNYYTQTLVANGSSVGAERYTGSFITISGGYSWRFAYLKLSENGKMNVWFNEFDDESGIFDFRQFQSAITSTATFNQIDKITLLGTTNANARIQIYRLTAEKVADITVASNTTQVDITGLNIDKGSEYLLVSDATQSDGNHQLYLYPNNLTNYNDYYHQNFSASGTSFNSQRYNFPRIAVLSPDGPTIQYTHIKISNTGAFTNQSNSLRNYGLSSNSIFNVVTSSVYENLTSISNLIVETNSTNSIKVGSRFELYKLY